MTERHPYRLLQQTLLNVSPVCRLTTSDSKGGDVIRSKYTVLCPGETITEVQRESIEKELGKSIETVVLKDENPFMGLINAVFSKMFFAEGVTNRFSAIVLTTSAYKKMGKSLRRGKAIHNQVYLKLVDESGKLIDF